MIAVIQAGGKGTRLRPYTLVLPKPMMPVGDQPVIEMLLKWLCRNGIRDVFITIGHLGRLIRSLCGDGSQWGMRIRYCEEPEAYGTIGPLRLIRKELTETFLVLNGDLVTDLDLRGFIAWHRGKGGRITVAVTQKQIKVDLGILESQNDRITEFREKPLLNFQVSMGIYCMEPEIIRLIPKGTPYGFDNLMHAMLEKKWPVYTYKHDGLWMDIGREEDFKNAQKMYCDNEVTLTGC